MAYITRAEWRMPTGGRSPNCGPYAAFKAWGFHRRYLTLKQAQKALGQYTQLFLRADHSSFMDAWPMLSQMAFCARATRLAPGVRLVSIPDCDDDVFVVWIEEVDDP